MLVDTASQYGVTSIYLLAGWFQRRADRLRDARAPDRRADRTVVRARATACCGWPALRARSRRARSWSPSSRSPTTSGIPSARCRSRARCASGCRWPWCSPPSCERALAAAPRALARARRVRVARAARVVARVVRVHARRARRRVACVRAWLAPGAGRAARGWPPGGRWRPPRASCAHVVFAGATLAATGELPDWGEYLAYLREFLVGRVGDLTYDVAALDAGAAVGAGVPRLGGGARPSWCAADGRIVETRAARRWSPCGHHGVRDRAAQLLRRSLAGPHPHPCRTAGRARWRRCGSACCCARPAPSHRGAAGGLGFGLAVAALVVAVAWSSVGERFPRTALSLAPRRAAGRSPERSTASGTRRHWTRGRPPASEHWSATCRRARPLDHRSRRISGSRS